MYRVPAIVPPESISLAEQYRKLSDATKKKIEEEKQKSLLDSTSDNKVRKLYTKVLRDIKKESGKGNYSLFWSNRDAFIFGKWTLSLQMAIAICNLLKKDNFSCIETESCYDPGQYYISVNW